MRRACVVLVAVVAVGASSPRARAQTCTTNVPHGGRKATTVRLNAPYVLPLNSKPGWIIVPRFRTSSASPALLTT